MIYDVYILSLQHSYHSSIFRLMHRHYVNSIHRDLSSKVLFQSRIHHRTILQRCSYFASLTVLLESKTFQNIQMQLSNVVKFGRVHLSVCRMEEINTRRERKKRTTSENKWFGTSTKSTGTFVWMVCSPVILQTYQEVAPAIQGSKQEPRKVGQNILKTDRLVCVDTFAASIRVFILCCTLMLLQIKAKRTMEETTYCFLTNDGVFPTSSSWGVHLWVFLRTKPSRLAQRPQPRHSKHSYKAQNPHHAHGFDDVKVTVRHVIVWQPEQRSSETKIQKRSAGWSEN